MLNIVLRVYRLLEPEERRKVIVAQVLAVLMSIFELLNIFALAYFIGILAQPDLAASGLEYLNGYFDELSLRAFYGYFAGSVLLMLIISTVLSVLTIWNMAFLAHTIGGGIANRLFQKFINMNWAFHLENPSSNLMNIVAIESIRVTDNFIYPLLQLNARLMSLALICLGLFIYDPIVAVSGFVLMSGAYLLLYKAVRAKLQENSVTVSEVAADRISSMQDAFGALKDVKLSEKEGYFLSDFFRASKKYAYAVGLNSTIAIVPRYVMEFFVFGTILSCIVVQVVFFEKGIDSIIPVLALYGLAGLKMLPALQLAYASFTQIRGNMASFEAVEASLVFQEGFELSKEELPISNGIGDLRHQIRSIEVEALSYNYPGSNKKVLNNISLKIEAGQAIGIVGPSGSGKSTLIDLLLGLTVPVKGAISIKTDSQILRPHHSSWRHKIGFVPQSIYLRNGTVRDNICFGERESEYDQERLDDAVHMSHLTDVICKLKDGLDSRVGEHGNTLSGGQKQRLGIARALYCAPEVLLFDEATSALDGITERIVSEAIEELGGDKTIIMVAHRLQTVKNCDVIYYMDNGRIVDKGTYHELLERNNSFRAMAGEPVVSKPV